MNHLNPKKKFELVRALKQKRKKNREISEETGIPIGTIKNISYAIKRGLKSIGELHNYQARQRINPDTGRKFESGNELQNYYARQRINPDTGEKFESLTELHNYQARQRINPDTGEKFESRTELQNYYARQRINPDTGEKFESLGELHIYKARQRGYDSMSHFVNIRREIRKKSPKLAEKLLSPERIKTLESLGEATYTRDYRQTFNKEGYSALLDAIPHLRGRKREIILRLLNGETITQIAETDSVSVQTISFQKISAVYELKRILKNSNSQSSKKESSYLPFWELSESQRPERKKAKNSERYTLS